MTFDKVYYEPDSLNYETGKYLKEKFSSLPWIPIENHNSIEEFQKSCNKDFPTLKRHLIVGIRKTHKYTPNEKCSDYLVPYTSSGCSAMCMYCYLVCNYNKCSYMRLFVNREEMMNKIIRTAGKADKDLTFEIGSNSDLILENTITNNLVWTIENFAKSEKGFVTFPTKFGFVDNLLPLDHQGKTIIRMSVNPDEVISKVEFGTSRLPDRVTALNKLTDAGYKTGLLIAPIVLIGDWKKNYLSLLDYLYENLNEKTKKNMFIEMIFMTYSYIHRAINNEAFPNAVELYDKGIMKMRGYGKYTYREGIRAECEDFLTGEIDKRFNKNKIVYIV